MMQMTSGLTPLQVRKAKLGQARETTFKLAFGLQPVILFGIGLGLLTDGIGRSLMIAAVLMVVAAMVSGAAHAFLKVVTARLQEKGATQLVIRDGLMRQVPADQVVNGDQLVVTAGQTLLVDVADVASRAPWWLHVLAKVTGQALPAGVAGSVVEEDGVATVLAIGNRRFLFASLQTQVSVDWMTIKGQVQALFGLPLALVSGLMSFKFTAYFKAFNQLAVKQVQKAVASATVAAYSLIESIRQFTTEVAIQYSQGPVPTR